MLPVLGHLTEEGKVIRCYSKKMQANVLTRKSAKAEEGIEARL